MDKERNLTFSYFKALLIIMVIDDHIGSMNGLLTRVFPYNSFYMPAFVFISGYFFKQKTVRDNLTRKCCSIMFPYIFWVFIEELLAFVLAKANIVHWFIRPNMINLSSTLLFEPLSEIASPGWFAVMLFEVFIIYVVVMRITPRNKISDYLILLAVISLGLFSVWISMNYFNADIIWIILIRTGFYLQFFHIGYMFHQYFEKTVIKWNAALVCLLCILLNLILVTLFGDKILFPVTSQMLSFKSWYLPLVTSITGCLFWYEVMSFLSRKFGKNDIVEFISRNTFTIMMVHLILVRTPYFFAKNLTTFFPDFDAATFDSSIWYFYDNVEVNLIGFFVGIAGSIAIAWLTEKATIKLKTCFSSNAKST